MIRELTYVGEKTHTTIEHHNHSVNYVRFPFLKEDERKALLEDFPFNDEAMFKTALFDKDVRVIFLSTLPEHSLGVYQNKETGYKFAWGEWNRPLTDPDLWQFYVEEKSSYNGDITLDWLKDFSSKWEYVGRITIEEYIENLEYLLRHSGKETVLCMLLGSEIEYADNANDAYNDRHLDHKKFNDALKNWGEGNGRIRFIEFTKYIHSQSDYVNNINHFQRRIYFDMANEVNNTIEDILGTKIKRKSKFTLYFDNFAFAVRKLVKGNDTLKRLLRKVYGIFRKSTYTAK